MRIKFWKEFQLDTPGLVRSEQRANQRKTSFGAWNWTGEQVTAPFHIVPVSSRRRKSEAAL